MDLSGLAAWSQAGETAAFGALTRHYQDMAFGYALALLSDFHLVQDVTQESFLAAYLSVRGPQDPAASPPGCAASRATSAGARPRKGA